MNRLKSAEDKEFGLGVLYAILAYSSWGILPLYWKLVDTVPASEILMHRIFWSFFFLIFVLIITSRWAQFINEFKRITKNKISMLLILAAAILITANWFIYIWAVNNEQTVEASLGYYINPLVSVLLGVIVLKEIFAFWQGISFFIAGIGVFILTIQFGGIPWVALGLAFTFGFYGLVKKMAKLGPIVSLTIETMLMVPIALIYLSSLQITGEAAFANSSFFITVVLIGAGVITAMPLLWFAESTARIPLYMVGFFQYIAPTIQLVLAIFLFKEPFSTVHLVSFSFIWIALLLFSCAKTKPMLRLQHKMIKKKTVHTT
ncbi:protein RarD [Lottiidibacillus patelloidae]|uniref:Protein RarD n=1 Tax=Lottiidibacillus patelloidae TaxID=2670334 RepID=A0A263BRT0_9BACI|nr:EamA family transporter RarD [Lottiidibacillus patelloidae]OZM56278.1 protein RarD [Lottiidibacillus patelloidae]